jgi:hypothetical protein
LANRQQRTNREKRKPKTDKKKPAAQTSPFPPAPGMAKPKGAAGKKGR